MRRTVVFVCGSLVLLFSACTASAEEQVNQPADSNVPAKAIKRAPVRTVEANAPPAALQRERFEQTRRQARERIRQREGQRQGRFAPSLEANEPNVPARLRIPPPQIPGNEVNEVNRADQFKHQLTMIEQQLESEKNQHLDRIAKLNRIRELAGQQGDNEATARADTLIEKENQLYQIKSQRMEMRKERVKEFLEKGPPPMDANRAGFPAMRRGERFRPDANRPAPPVLQPPPPRDERSVPSEIQKKPALIKPVKEANQPAGQNK